MYQSGHQPFRRKRVLLGARLRQARNATNTAEDKPREVSSQQLHPGARPKQYIKTFLLNAVCVDIVLQPPKTHLRTDHLTFISCASTTQAPEFPTMASQVVTNFEKHLAQLAEGASRESIQTLSKYMAFNRKKHGAALCEALSNAIRTKATTPGRKMLYLNVMHEVLISESPLQAGYQNDKKWDRLADLRSQLGENVVVDAIASVRDCAGTSEADLAKIRNWIEQWEEIEAFGGPTIVLGARRALTAEKTTKKTESVEEEKADAPSTSDDAAAAKETPTSESTPSADKADTEEHGKDATESKDTDMASPTSKVKNQDDSNDGGKSSSTKDENDAGATTSPPVDLPPAFDFDAEVRSGAFTLCYDI